MKILTMALRNVGRTRRRALVTMSAMAFAGAMMIFYVALMSGFTASMERHALSMETGDLQIHAEGYLDDPNLYARIDDSAEVLAELESKGLKATQRLYGYGLVAAGESSSGAQLRGIDLGREPQVTRLPSNVRDGQWLSVDDPQGVVIGHKLARTLDVGVGAELVLLSQDAQGFTANDLYKVRGVLGTVGETVDRSGVLMGEGAFRRLMAVERGAHQIVVARPELNADVDALRDEVQALAPKHDVRTWRTLLPVLATMLESSMLGIYLMMTITYAAVAMVILNAMLMSVFERIREFGVMKALGVSPWQVGALIVLEALLQALIAGFGATALGLPVALYFQRYGIDLSTMMDTINIGGVALKPVWYCHVTVGAVTTPVGFLLIITALSVLYPASKAAWIRPVDALRHR